MPIRPEEGFESDFDLQADARSAARLPVTMMAPVDPRTVADAELDVDSDGVIDRRRPPFRAKDDRATRLVQARGRDLQGPADPFGNLDRFEPPAAVAWPEPGPRTTPAEVSNEGVKPVPEARPTSAFVPVSSVEPVASVADSNVPVDASDPFADLRLPPIPSSAQMGRAASPSPVAVEEPEARAGG